MAITSGFFNSIDGDRKYNSDQMSTYFEGLVSDGIYENIGERFVVTAGTGMTVNVGTGRALIKSHWIKNDAALTLTLDPADVQLPRIDTIVLRYDAQESGRNISVTVVTGTPAANPTFTYRRGENVYDLVIATVRVNKNATEIIQSNITDRRSSNLCGWVTGIIKQVDTSDLFLQWQQAYEDYYEQSTGAFNSYMAAKRTEFENWFNSLTETLTVNTSITKYQNTVTVTGETSEINIGISQYDPEKDVLCTFVGGVLFIEGDEYTISGTGATAKITLAKNLKGENEVTFIVLKNIIDGSASGGGDIEERLTTVENELAAAENELSTFETFVGGLGSSRQTEIEGVLVEQYFGADYGYTSFNISSANTFEITSEDLGVTFNPTTDAVFGWIQTTSTKTHEYDSDTFKMSRCRTTTFLSYNKKHPEYYAATNANGSLVITLSSKSRPNNARTVYLWVFKNVLPQTA